MLSSVADDQYESRVRRVGEVAPTTYCLPRKTIFNYCNAAKPVTMRTRGEVIELASARLNLQLFQGETTALAPTAP